MSRELTTEGTYNNIRSILLDNHPSFIIDTSCFKRADIINALYELNYIRTGEFSYYDIARTV